MNLRIANHFLLTLLAASAASGIDLPVAADVHVGANTPQTGSLPNLTAGGGNRVLLRFDLSPLPAGLSPTQVVKATLVFHVNRIAAAGTLRLAPLVGPFEELTVTEGTAPPAGVSLGQRNPVQGLNLMDVTALVQQWVTSPASAFGIEIAAAGSAPVSVLMDSKENIATSFPAEIRVVLSGPAGPVGAVGPVGATGPTGATGAASPSLQAGLCELLRSSNHPLPPGLDCSWKRMFVTNGSFTGNLGGLQGADNLCMMEATAMGIGGSYKAWLSDATQSAASRMTQSSVPYRRADGALIAYNWADLTDGALHVSLNLNGSGASISSPFLVWTNTATDGRALGSHCQNWTLGTNESSGHGGWTLATDSGWTTGRMATCNVSARLYCVQQ